MTGRAAGTIMIQVRLPLALREQVHALARSRGISTADLIRSMLHAELKRDKRGTK